MSIALPALNNSARSGCLHHPIGMDPNEQYWLVATLTTWAFVSFIVLGAMLRVLVRQRRSALDGPPIGRTNLLTEAAWTLSAIAMVAMVLLLTIR
jgi:heme/copper-type cytochrome/quinol oxidase subunit 2